MDRDGAPPMQSPPTQSPPTQSPLMLRLGSGLGSPFVRMTSDEARSVVARTYGLRVGGMSRIATERDDTFRVAVDAADYILKIALDRDRVTLSVTSPENGLATEELAADYTSDAIEIGFNARYLLDILAQIEGDTVEVHLADAAAPTLLRENDKSDALYVIMPMRV